jgi:ABC-type lipoprotein export system ATPase subunit
MDEQALLLAAERIEELTFRNMDNVIDSVASTEAEKAFAIMTHEMATELRREIETDYDPVVDEKFAEQIHSMLGEM